jgi:hypothetical protein
MKTRLLLLPLLLAGCGKAAVLHPQEGAALPVAPYGAKVQPDAVALSTPPSQARPPRSDELLRSSQDRREDEFDLPPPN